MGNRCSIRLCVRLFLRWMIMEEFVLRLTIVDLMLVLSGVVCHEWEQALALRRLPNEECLVWSPQSSAGRRYSAAHADCLMTLYKSNIKMIIRTDRSELFKINNEY